MQMAPFMRENTDADGCQLCQFRVVCLQILVSAHEHAWVWAPGMVPMLHLPALIQLWKCDC